MGFFKRRKKKKPEPGRNYQAHLKPRADEISQEALRNRKNIQHYIINCCEQIIEAKKEQGSQDIEFHLVEAKPSDWTNQVVDFYQLKEEISRKGKEYIESVIAFNADNKTIIAKIQREFQ